MESQPSSKAWRVIGSKRPLGLIPADRPRLRSGLTLTPLCSIIAFAIVTETVFQWPGMGFLFIQSVQFADIPVMAAYLVLISLVFVTINLIVDLLYYVVDPRLRIERTAGAH